MLPGTKRAAAAAVICLRSRWRHCSAAGAAEKKRPDECVKTAVFTSCYIAMEDKGE